MSTKWKNTSYDLTLVIAGLQVLKVGEMTCYIQRCPAIFRDGKSAIPNCGVVIS